MIKYFAAITLAFSVLTVSAQKAKPKAKPVAQKTPQPVLENGIKLQATGGVVVEKAHLQFEDGISVPANNTVNVNQIIYLILELKGGWVPVDDNIQIGAKEVITTSTGTQVIKSDDLFANLKTVSIEDSKYISLKAVITGQDKVIPYFVVSFEVWDKQGNGKIKGSYRFKTTWKKEG